MSVCNSTLQRVVPSFPELWDVMRMLLVLSHGQASVERGFSINRYVLVEKPLAWPGVHG